MQVTLNRLEQSYPLDGSPVHTYLILTLPSGESVRAQVSNESAEALIKASMSGEEAQQSLEEPQRSSPTEESALQVDWESLPDSVLAPVYKQIMRDVGAPPLLAVTEFERLTDEISEHLHLQAQEQLEVQEKPSDLAVPHVVPRRRKVEMDEMGYPVVPNLRKPLDTQDSDEDGVAQL